MAEQPWSNGPWRYDEYDHVVDADGEPVATSAGAFSTYYSNSVPPTDDAETAEANSRLFFAAPTMYNALRAIYGKLADGLASPEEVDLACRVAEDAMKKARGNA